MPNKIPRFKNKQQQPQPRDNTLEWSTSRWQKFRALFIHDHPLCQECLKTNKLTAATDVDHIIRREKAPDRIFDESNCQSLCHVCHSKKTRAEQKDLGKGETPSPRG